MEEMNSIVTSFNKEKQEIIYHTNNENNYRVVQEICRLYIDRSSMTKEIERLNSIINKLEQAIIDHKDIKMKSHCGEYYVEIEDVLNKLKELRGDKE